MTDQQTVPRVLADGIGSSMTPASEADLVRGLDEIDRAATERGEPIIATLFLDTDQEDPPKLSIGLGAEESVLVYSAGDWSGEGGFSKGPRTDDTEVSFRFGTATNEYLGWMLIPKSLAYDAARQFFRTGRQPTIVDWGDV